MTHFGTRNRNAIIARVPRVSFLIVWPRRECDSGSPLGIGDAGRGLSPWMQRSVDEDRPQFVEGLDGGDDNACAGGQLVIDLHKPS